MSLLFRAHTHLPKVTNRPQTRHQHLHRVFGKKNERLIKIKHRTSTNNGGHVKQLYFALDSALTSRASPTMPTTRPFGNPQHVHRYKETTELSSANGAVQSLLNCNVQTPSPHIFVWKTQSLLPGFVAAYPVAVLHRNRSRHACRHGPSGSPAHVSGEI